MSRKIKEVTKNITGDMVFLHHFKIFNNGTYQMSVGELEIIARALREYEKKNCGKKCPSKDLCSAYDSCPDIYLDIAESLKGAGRSKRVFPDEEVRRRKDCEPL